ncbi:MAG: S8 family serine peptidase, partial [Caldilineaceae bacterium]|nr:S8 family serine peptidase [Caldilineaceae bacterium]
MKTVLGFSEGDQLSSFSSRGPRMDAETGLQILKPDLAAPGDFIFSTDVGTGTEGTSLGGTSMASPHITGSAALMRELHPTWTVAQIKALLMNTATNDVWTEPDQTGSNYGVSRVGSGRVDLANAINTETVAYATNAPERVSVSFGLIEAVTAQTLNQTITVRNLGATPRTYNVTFDQRNNTSMAAFSVSPSSINVPANGSTTVTVTLTLDPTASQSHTPDATTDLLQSRLLGTGPRHFVAEEGGYVVLTPTDSSSSLRVAVHAVPRPASDMAAASDTVTVSTAATGVTTIDLTGTEVFTGGNLPYDTMSIVTAFEKVYESPNDAFSPAGYDRGDLQYIGLASDLSFWLDQNDGDLNAALADTTIYMALTVYGDWSTANAYETLFDIYFDIDGDDASDLNLFNWDLGTAANLFGVGDDPSDIFVGPLLDVNASALVDLLIPNEFFASEIDTYLLNNNVVVFPIPAEYLELTSSNSTINFYVDVLGELYFTDSTQITTPGPYISYDIAAAPFSFNDDSGLQGGPFPYMSWYPDLDGLFIPVDYDLSGTTTPPEILLLHHHNVSGSRVEVLTVDINGEADLEAGINASEETPEEGAVMTTMAEATNNGPAPAEGIVIEHTLPVGLTYTGDDCPTVSVVTGGSGSPTVITCDYDTTVAPPNFVLTLQVGSTVDAGTDGSDLVITTDVSYSATSGNTETDTSNNTAARRVCVDGNIETCNATPVKTGSGGGETIGDFVVPNMLFAITPMSSFAQPGDSVEWKVTINNTTGTAINDASINLTLPGNISIQSATSTSGTVSTGTQLAYARYTMGPLGQPRSFSQSAQQTVVQFAQDVIQAGEQVIITINTLIPTSYSQSSVVMNGTL